MSIIYTLISRNNDVILVEQYTAVGNFPQIARNIISKIQPNTKKSYSYNERFVFHFINEENFTYLCLADEGFAQNLAFLFLEDIKNKFIEKYPTSQRMTALSFALNSSFSDTVLERMKFYNTNKDTNKITQIKSNLNKIQEVMIENIDQILERQYKVEILVKKTATMNSFSTNMKEQVNEIYFVLKIKKRLKILERMRNGKAGRPKSQQPQRFYCYCISFCRYFVADCHYPNADEML